jgi:F420-0:gamma-glutamyl ligase-like protein
MPFFANKKLQKRTKRERNKRTTSIVTRQDASWFVLNENFETLRLARLDCTNRGSVSGFALGIEIGTFGEQQLETLDSASVHTRHHQRFTLLVDLVQLASFGESSLQLVNL